MKKIFFLSVLALALASCSDNDGPWGTPQVNEQLPTFTVSDIELTATTQAQQTINLLEYNGNDQAVPVLTVSRLDNMPEGYELEMVMYLKPDENSDRVAEIPAETVVDETGTMTITVAPDEWQAAYVKTISKSPKAKDVYVYFAPYAVKDGETVRLGMPDLYLAPMTVNVLPFPGDFVIEDNYYLLGTINGWSVAEAVKFDHSGESVYDDPEFTITVNIEGTDGWWWKIVPESTYLAGNWVEADNAAFGVAENGSAALDGMLVGRTAAEDCGAGCLKVTGPFLMTINMEDLTYKFEPRVQTLYTPGASNSWSQAASQQLVTTDYANYYGFAYLSTGGFKFTTSLDWNTGTNYGSTGTEGALSTSGAAGDLTVPETGIYWCAVNTPELKYKLTHIASIGAIGDFNGWAASVALKPEVDEPLVWSGVIDFGDGSGAFKIRCNDGWDISLGGDPDNLGWDNAPNMSAPGAGEYVVTLYLDALPYVVEFVKK